MLENDIANERYAFQHLELKEFERIEKLKEKSKFAFKVNWSTMARSQRRARITSRRLAQHLSTVSGTPSINTSWLKLRCFIFLKRFIMAVQASQDHFIQASSCRSFHKSLLSQSQDVHKKKKKKSNLGLMGRTELKKAITERRNLVFSIQTRTSGKQITGNPNCS